MGTCKRCGKVNPGIHTCSSPMVAETITTPTASDLRRWFDGPWCSECAAWIDDCDCKLTGVERPSLWSRMPSAKPAGLEFRRHALGCYRCAIHGRWTLTVRAADRCIMGVVNSEAVPWDGEGLKFWASVYEIIHERSCSLPEAVAIAYHKWLDSQEKT